MPDQFIPASQGWVDYVFNNVAAGNGELLFTERDDPNYIALDNVSVTAAGVPDSGSTMAMMSFGLLGLGGVARRFRR